MEFYVIITPEDSLERTNKSYLILQLMYFYKFNFHHLLNFWNKNVLTITKLQWTLRFLILEIHIDRIKPLGYVCMSTFVAIFRVRTNETFL